MVSRVISFLGKQPEHSASSDQIPKLIATGAVTAGKTSLGACATATRPVCGAFLGLTWALGTCVISPAVDWSLEKLGMAENQAMRIMKVVGSFFAGGALGILATYAIMALIGTPITFSATLSLAATMLLIECKVGVVAAGVIACLYAVYDCLRTPQPSDLIQPDKTTTAHVDAVDEITNHAVRSMPFLAIEMQVINLLSTMVRLKKLST